MMANKNIAKLKTTLREIDGIPVSV